MFNRRFNDAVMRRVVNIQNDEARARKVERAPRYTGDDVVCFVDLQNLHYFLKENCKLPATQVNILDLLHAFAAEHGMTLKEMRIFTGIHDRRREPAKHDGMAARVRWMERNGALVTTLPLSYYQIPDTDQFRVEEKGIDVRIGSEIQRAVAYGLRRALVVTQDKDISQAVKVAGEMAADAGSDFTAFSMTLEGTRWEHNRKCGMHGIMFTDKLPITVDFCSRFVRAERAEKPDRPERAELSQ